MFNEIEKHIEKKSKVISMRYGVGEIVGSFAMYDGVDDYLEVIYSVDGKSRYFCAKHVNDVRLISSRKKIDFALKLMNEKLRDESVENNALGDVDFLDKSALYVIGRIVGLLRKQDLSIKDSVLLHSTIDSLIHEVEEVYGVDHISARGIVSDYLKAA